MIPRLICSPLFDLKMFSAVEVMILSVFESCACLIMDWVCHLLLQDSQKLRSCARADLSRKRAEMMHTYAHCVMPGFGVELGVHASNRIAWDS